MAIHVVYPDAGQLPGGLASTNLGTEASPWLGWASVIWGGSGSGVRPSDTLYIRGNWLSSAVMSVGNHGANSVANKVTIVIDDGVIIDFSSAGHFFWNTRPYTIIRGGALGTGSVMRIVAQAGAENCEYYGFKIAARGRSGFDFGTSAAAHKNIYVHDLVIDGANAYPTNSISHAIGGYVDTATACSYDNIRIENITVTNFVATRGVLSIFLAANPVARAKDIIINNITMSNVRGLPIDIECAGPNGGFGVIGTIDWSEGIRITNIKVNEQKYGITYNANPELMTENNFGGLVFCSGFANSSTPGFGPNWFENWEATNIQGNAGFMDILFGTYQGRRFRLNGLQNKDIDGCVILFDAGCHHCSFEDIEASNVSGYGGKDHPGSFVLVLENVTSCRVSGAVLDNVWAVLGAYDTKENSDVLVSNVTATNVQSHGTCISSNVSKVNGIRLVNSTISGNGVAVKNKTAIPWTSEDSNYWNMIGGVNTNHTFGSRSKTGVDPQIDPVTKRPLPGSPLIGAGIHAGSLRDKAGRRFKARPTIGAFEDNTLQPRVLRQ